MSVESVLREEIVELHQRWQAYQALAAEAELSLKGFLFVAEAAGVDVSDIAQLEEEQGEDTEGDQCGCEGRYASPCACPGQW